MQAGGLVVFCSGDVLVEGECLVVVGFGVGWFAPRGQAGGEEMQVLGLLLLGVGECLVEGECLVVVGFGLGWFAQLT